MEAWRAGFSPVQLTAPEILQLSLLGTRMRLELALLIGCIGAPLSAQVPQGDVDRAQAAMLNRVVDAVDAYAAHIGIDRAYVTYCDNRMSLDESRAPAGLIPFAVDYRNISDKYQLDTILNAREQFERSYLTLCLADAKRTLEAAEKR